MSCCVYILGNALDDATRAERCISTDSPAASRKIFMLAALLRGAGVRAVVLSLGRGRQDGSGRAFSRVVRRVGHVPIVYLSFLNRPVLSKMRSAFEPIGVLWRRRSTASSSTVLFYNRMPGYLPTLLVARLLGYRAVLDLEDGEVGLSAFSRAGLGARISRPAFDTLCNGGAMLACSALAAMTRLSPTLCYYGTMDPRAATPVWIGERITVLLGGTLARSTGAPLLAAAIRLARNENDAFWRRLRVVVTGYGESAAEFAELAKSGDAPTLEFLGRTSDDEYRRLLDSTQVGLALKPADGLLAHSTFPSKVIEFASSGVLVVTTDISDIRRVLGAGALYLERETPQELLETLRAILRDRARAEAIAQEGRAIVAATCAPTVVAARVAALLCGHRA